MSCAGIPLPRFESQSPLLCEGARFASQMMRLFLKVLAALMAAFLLYNLWIFGHIVYWRGHNPSASSFMNEQLAKLQQDDPEAELRHKWVSYEQISPISSAR